MFKYIEEQEVAYQTSLASGIDLKAMNIIKVFNKDGSIPDDKLAEVRRTFSERGIRLRSRESILFGTGLKLDNSHLLWVQEELNKERTIPLYDKFPEVQIRPRSSFTKKNGLTIPNAPGTIDLDYEGEICVCIHNPITYTKSNAVSESFIEKGERIAQLVVTVGLRLTSVNVIETLRGEGGFGSTGK